MVTKNWLQSSLFLGYGVLSALLYASAYSPYIDPNQAWMVQNIGLAGFLLWVETCPKGWYMLHGMSFLTLFWLAYPLNRMVQIPMYLALPVVAGLIAVFTLVKAWPMVYITRRFPMHHISWNGVYWAAVETFQIYVLTFPWILWVQPQGPSPLTGILSVIPTHLWVIIVFASWDLIVMGSPWNIPIALLGLYGSSLIPTTASTLPLSFGVVQGYIDKRPSKNTAFDSRDTLHRYHLDKYAALTATLGSVDIVVWPECIIGSVVKISSDEVKDYFHVLDSERTFILGTCFTNITRTQGLNAAAYVDHGMHRERIKKYYAPLGEYAPAWVAWIITSIMPNIRFLDVCTGEFKIFDYTKDGENIRILPLICYESAFAPFESLPEREVIVIISENIWFGSTFAQYQQLSYAQLTAHKHHTPVILSSNNGISAWINESGMIVHSLPPNTEGVLTIPVQHDA